MVGGWPLEMSGRASKPIPQVPAGQKDDLGHHRMVPNFLSPQTLSGLAFHLPPPPLPMSHAEDFCMFTNPHCLILGVCKPQGGCDHPQGLRPGLPSETADGQWQR